MIPSENDLSNDDASMIVTEEEAISSSLEIPASTNTDHCDSHCAYSHRPIYDAFPLINDTINEADAAVIIANLKSNGIPFKVIGDNLISYPQKWFHKHYRTSTPSSVTNEGGILVSENIVHESNRSSGRLAAKTLQQKEFDLELNVAAMRKDVGDAIVPVLFSTDDEVNTDAWTTPSAEMSLDDYLDDVWENDSHDLCINRWNINASVTPTNEFHILPDKLRMIDLLQWDDVHSYQHLSMCSSKFHLELQKVTDGATLCYSNVIGSCEVVVCHRDDIKHIDLRQKSLFEIDYDKCPLLAFATRLYFIELLPREAIVIPPGSYFEIRNLSKCLTLTRLMIDQYDMPFFLQAWQAVSNDRDSFEKCFHIQVIKSTLKPLLNQLHNYKTTTVSTSVSRQQDDWNSNDNKTCKNMLAIITALRHAIRDRIIMDEHSDNTLSSSTYNLEDALDDIDSAIETFLKRKTTFKTSVPHFSSSLASSGLIFDDRSVTTSRSQRARRCNCTPSQIQTHSDSCSHSLLISNGQYSVTLLTQPNHKNHFSPDIKLSTAGLAFLSTLKINESQLFSRSHEDLQVNQSIERRSTSNSSSSSYEPPFKNNRKIKPKLKYSKATELDFLDEKIDDNYTESIAEDTKKRRQRSCRLKRKVAMLDSLSADESHSLVDTREETKSETDSVSTYEEIVDTVSIVNNNFTRLHENKDHTIGVGSYATIINFANPAVVDEIIDRSVLCKLQYEGFDESFNEFHVCEDLLHPEDFNVSIRLQDIRIGMKVQVFWRSGARKRLYLATIVEHKLVTDIVPSYLSSDLLENTSLDAVYFGPAAKVVFLKIKSLKRLKAQLTMIFPLTHLVKKLTRKEGKAIKEK